MDGDRGNVNPVDQDLARANVIKTADQIDNGGLACSGRADYRIGFSLTDTEMDMV